MARPHIFIASHHKVGTVWMMTTFNRIAAANAWAFDPLNRGELGWNLRPDPAAYLRQRLAQSDPSEDPTIFFNFHADIPDLRACLAPRQARGLHIIRDPRDMLLSAVRFHLRADEPWLDEPDQVLGNQTFRAKLAACGTLEDQIQLEMDTHMGRTIRNMADFDSQGVFINLKYEDLITDHDMRHFHAALVHLGLKGRELINALDAYWRSSLFGERSEHDIHSTRNHVFNAEPNQWQTAPKPVIDLIEHRFARQITALGYRLSSQPG